jgi:hypothetical protein
MNSDGRIWKLNEIQNEFHVSRATVWRWRNNFGLKVVQIGGVVRVKDSDLQEFLTRHTA